MNFENLHELIRRYEDRYYEFNNDTNREIFKWKAVKCFQSEWFSPANENSSFSELFAKAKSESSVLIDNRTVAPANGIVKMAQEDPAEVARLFREVLYADDGGDLDLRQTHMEEFLEGIEAVRLKYFPACWKYKQDRHSASCYLTLYAPEKNYIYKYSHAEAFARHIEFGKDIGSGENFSLENYYEMCDIVADTLREHKTLLDKYEKLLTDDHYHDQSLHLLAFDLIYCAATYGLYRGLVCKPKKESIRDYTLQQLREAEEAKLQAQIDELETKIQDLEDQMDIYRSINLVGVKVFQKALGEGTVIMQDMNKIRVRFGCEEKSFVIHKQYHLRPTFEDDTEIVEAMTEYADKSEEIKMLVKQLERLRQ